MKYSNTIDEIPSNRRKSINLFVLWKTQKPFAIFINVTISAFDGTESQSNVEQNQQFGPKSSVATIYPLQQLAMDSLFMSSQDYGRSPHKLIKIFQISQLIARAYFAQLEHWT